MTDSFEQLFKKPMQDIRFSDGQKALLCSRIETAAALQKKGDEQMEKRILIPRAATITAVLILATTVTVFAAGKIIGVGSHSRSSYDFTTQKELQTALEEAGFQALPETFPDGFAMDGGNIVTNEGLDETDTVVDTWETISVTYKDKEGRSLYVDLSHSSDRYEDRSTWPEPTERRKIQGIDVSYDHSEHFIVPPDYDVDEETKERAEKDDHFAIAYGSAKPETMFFDTVQFMKENTEYSIFSSEGVAKETLFTIAEEIIE